MTPFQSVYDAFFRLVTDDMYMEITEEETRADCKDLLLISLPMFEFPEEVIDVNDDDTFSRKLSLEEINILAYGMLQAWLQRQITSIEHVRQKFSGADFKLSSQASHLQRLMSLFTQTKDEYRRLMMINTRRKRVGNKYESTFGKMVERMK